MVLHVLFPLIKCTSILAFSALVVSVIKLNREYLKHPSDLCHGISSITIFNFSINLLGQNTLHQSVPAIFEESFLKILLGGLRMSALRKLKMVEIIK